MKVYEFGRYFYTPDRAFWVYPHRFGVGVSYPPSASERVSADFRTLVEAFAFVESYYSGHQVAHWESSPLPETDKEGGRLVNSQDIQERL